MDCLLLRFDAPLMSFGGVMVDQINPVDRFPGRSLLSGMFGNSLGWDHRDVVRLQSLQDRLLHASRWDVEPERTIDYQTVDLGQDFMQDTGWTTRGRREDRGSGEATSGTHQRYRHYWANGIATVAVALLDAPTNGAGPDSIGIDALQRSLERPARPLFLGRKTCLPSTRLLLGRRKVDSLRAALEAEPLAATHGRPTLGPITACWPISEGIGRQIIEFADTRDWRNNIHRGSTRYAVGELECRR